MNESDAPWSSPAIQRRVVSEREWLFRVFFLGAFAYLIYQSLRILSPFVTALTAALIITLIFSPVHARLLLLVRRPNLAALLMTVVALVVVILPFLALGWLLLGEAAAVFPHLQDLIVPPDGSAHAAIAVPAQLQSLWLRVDAWFAHWQVDLRDIALGAAKQLGNSLTAFGTGVVKNSVLLVFDVVVLVLAMFFFFRDGPALARAVADPVPMEEGDKRMVIDQLDTTLSAIVRSAFITATAQGVLAGVGFAVAGVRFPVLLGFATALLAVVPVVGAGIVWAPVGGYLIYSGDTAAGAGILLWGALVVSMCDNLLRTVLISGQTQMSLLLLFPGVLGGIQVYGMAGALIGPLVIATLLAFARLYHDHYGGRSTAGR